MVNLKDVANKNRKAALSNNDGWSNVATGLGTKKDKSQYSSAEWNPTPRDICEALYSSDEIGAKSAKIIPYDATREGITWNMDQSADQEKIVKYLEKEFNRLNIWPKLAWAWTQARVYGGSLVFISVQGGGKDLSKPLDYSKIKKINSLTIFDRHDLTTNSSEIISDLSDPNYGTPEIYHYQSSSGAGMEGELIPIHHSRVLRFDGIRLPMRLYQRNNSWHVTIHGTLYDAIRK